MKYKRLWTVLFSLMIIALLGACSDSGSAEEVVDNEEAGTAETQADEQTERNPNDKVVTVNEEVFYQRDLEFYTLMKKIQIEINRYFDQENFEGAELSERNGYWDEQLDYHDNINVQLQNLIEIHAMRLLAEEKHYDIPQEKLEKEVEAFTEGLSDMEGARELVEEFGEAEFNRNITAYMRESMLRDRVVDDLEKEIQAEDPDITEAEMNYTLSQKYEELYMDQIGDLEITIHVK